jgi:hypothetical protein
MMATKAARRARNERQRQADIARTEAALAITCPVCKTAPGIWCGPVLDHFVSHPVTPWMHERRYAHTEQKGAEDG